MNIGVISGAEICEPVLYYLASKKASVSLFYAGSPEAAITNRLVRFCETYHLPIVTETTKDHLYKWVHDQQPDVVFIMGYGRILNITRLGTLTSRMFNIHFGTLPGYRGPSPVFWQLKNGEKKIEVCIHRLLSKADAGPVVWRKTVPVEEFHTYSFLTQYLSNITVAGIAFILNSLLNGNKLPEWPQDETAARYYARPVLKDVLVNWSVMTAAAIFNLCRACNDWNRGAITSYKGVELKILDITIGTNKPDKEPGTILTTENHLLVACADGSCSLNFLNLNGLFFPGRYAKHVGMAAGHRLGV